jgi:predicted nucleotidyltransferase component of viral defense system
VDRVDEIVEAARSVGVRPWMALKEELARRVIQVAGRHGQLTLQGGAALHFVYGSPRLSADVDFVGNESEQALSALGEELARAAGDALGHPCRWSVTRSGRLIRGKLRLELGPSRALVLPVEAYEVPAHRAHARPPFGTVEDPEEILADKVVATAGRLASRGTIKTSDLFDLWYLREKLGVPPPDRALVALKSGDYGQERRGTDLAAAARAVTMEELQSALAGVLPAEHLTGLDATAVVETAAEVLDACRDVL